MNGQRKRKKFRLCVVKFRNRTAIRCISRLGLDIFLSQSASFRFIQRLPRSFLSLGLLLVLIPVSLHAERVRIAVAANFYPAMNELSDSFASSSQHRVELVVGSSGKLAAQIIQGAPFDLFLSADTSRPLELVRRGLVIDGHRTTYARGRLALLVAHQVPGGQKNVLGYSLRGLKDGNFERVAIANPSLAPYGRAALESIEALKIDVDRKRLVFGENISQTFHFFKAGHVDLAFVALSQVVDAGLDESEFTLVSEGLYAPIEQQMVLLSQKTAAFEIYAFLLSDEAQSIISRAGYHAIFKEEQG